MGRLSSQSDSAPIPPLLQSLLLARSGKPTVQQREHRRKRRWGHELPAHGVIDRRQACSSALATAMAIFRQHGVCTTVSHRQGKVERGSRSAIIPIANGGHDLGDMRQACTSMSCPNSDMVIPKYNNLAKQVGRGSYRLRPAAAACLLARELSLDSRDFFLGASSVGRDPNFLPPTRVKLLTC